MDEIINSIKAFCESDLGTAIITATLSFIYALVLFSKTSLGKKLFNKLIKKTEEAKEIAKIQTELTSQIKDESEKAYQYLKEDYESRLVVLANYNVELENVLIQIGDAIPNQKVKGVINSFIDSKNERLSAIKDKIPTFDKIEELQTSLSEKEQEVELVIKEEVSRYQQLYDEKTKELDALIEKYKLLVEADYGEKEQKEKDTISEEERIDSD